MPRLPPSLPPYHHYATLFITTPHHNIFTAHHHTHHILLATPHHHISHLPTSLTPHNYPPLTATPHHSHPHHHILRSPASPHQTSTLHPPPTPFSTLSRTSPTKQAPTGGSAMRPFSHFRLEENVTGERNLDLKTSVIHMTCFWASLCRRLKTILYFYRICFLQLQRQPKGIKKYT